MEGEDRLTARLASPNGRAEPNGAQDLGMLLNGFVSVTAPTIKSPSALARKLAALAQQVRHTVAYVRGDTRDEIRLVAPDGSGDRPLWAHN